MYVKVVDGYINTNLNKGKFISLDGKDYLTDLVKVIYKKYVIYGRKDTLVKIKGYRVELLDIDTKIRLLKNVTNCLVFSESISEYKKMIFSAIETSSNLQEKTVRTFKKIITQLYGKLAQFRCDKKFPVNKNGKIDRKFIH